MAVIKNEVPQPLQSDENIKKRVVVKFKPDVKLPYSDEAASEFARGSQDRWSELTETFAGVTLTPYFSGFSESSLRELGAPPSGTGGTPGFASYYAIEVPDNAEAESIAKMVGGWDNVEIAYVEGGPTPPPVNPSDDPRNPNQGYLDAAPAGIDARWAWSAGLDGTGTSFVDLERGWTLNHEDLAAAGLTIISGVNTDYPGHGTAVLGEVLAADNAIGGVGIAPATSGRVVSQWQPGGYNTAQAILSAAAVMSAGDVLLLEAQTSYSTAAGFVPVEVEQAAFDAIQFAVSKGIIVVEAGANGSVDLDAFQDTNGKHILDRSSADFRDSGAIMVGASSSATPHSRMYFSNYGSRIDCYGWGENIDTTGDGWTGNAVNTYTPDFGGTSGASPIVTGAALIMQSWRIKHGNPIYTPAEMRTLLSNPAKNTASANPASDRIGVMPDLRKLIEVARPGWWKYLVLAWAWIIVIGGLMITPGGVWCIKCGPGGIGYLGDTVINVLGLVTIALGVIGIVGAIKQRNSM